MNNTIIRLFLASLASLLFPTLSGAAILIDGFSSQINDRYSNAPSFVASGFDLSGVTIANTSVGGRWATMISPNIFISVHHLNFYPATGENITFYASNDALGTSTTRTVQGSQRIGTSDIRIGTLNSPLPSNYTYYDFANQPLETLTDFANSPYALENAYLFGRSPTSWSTGTDMTVGRNVLDSWRSNVDGSHDSVVAIRNSIGDANYVSSEAYLQSGDSGGPLMVDDGLGNFTIVGLNWYIDTVNGTDFSGFSYIGDYASEINDYLALNPVPESRHYGLLLGIAGLVLAFLRRRKLHS